jgi:hypothetical protein
LAFFSAAREGRAVTYHASPAASSEATITVLNTSGCYPPGGRARPIQGIPYNAVRDTPDI